MITKWLVNRIIEKYTQDMGCYFDDFKGQEEEVWEETYNLVKSASLKDKIKLLRGVY